MDGRTYGHFSPSNIIRSTFGSRPKEKRKKHNRFQGTVIELRLANSNVMAQKHIRGLHNISTSTSNNIMQMYYWVECIMARNALCLEVGEVVARW